MGIMPTNSNINGILIAPPLAASALMGSIMPPFQYAPMRPTSERHPFNSTGSAKGITPYLVVLRI